MFDAVFNQKCRYWIGAKEHNQSLANNISGCEDRISIEYGDVNFSSREEKEKERYSVDVLLNN